MGIQPVRSRYTRIGGFLFVLATMACVRGGRMQPGGDMPVAGYQQGPSDSLSYAGRHKVEIGSSVLPLALIDSNPDTAAKSILLQPELMPDGYDFALNLLDPASFKDGDKSFVIIDPSDRQKLKGIVRLTSKSLTNLMNEYTGLHIEIADNIDPLELPIDGVGIGTTQVGAQHLVEYLTHGGFVLGLGEPSPILRQALLRYAGLVSEIDYHSEGLMPDHPIFSAYFDLTPTKTMTVTGEPIRTKGFFIGKRLVGVRDMPGDERGLVNAVVFALTQPGGIARRYIRR